MTAEVVKSADTQVGGKAAASQPEVPEKLVEEEDVKVIEEDLKKSAQAQVEKGEEVSKEGDVKSVEKEDSSPVPAVVKNASFKEESNFLCDLKEHEKKALSELRAKVEEAILGNKLLKNEEEKVELKEAEKPKDEIPEKGETPKEREQGEAAAKEEEKKDGKPEAAVEEEEKSDSGVEEKAVVQSSEKGEAPDEKDRGSSKVDAEEKAVAREERAQKTEDSVEIDRDVSLWGVPLLPSKGDDATDVVLLKFLRAREFKVNDAFELLRSTLSWRKRNIIDSILDEEFDGDLGSVAYMAGVDRDGHPVCYNVYGVFGNQELYQKTFGTEEKREQFLRWRFQMMEKGIQKLDFKPGGIASILQITDLKNTPGLSKKELRIATKKAVGLLQDNYPEFVARNIFINVPFWYYAFNAVISPFLTQRTKSKFVFARPSRVTETLLKYIPPVEVLVQHGGLKRLNDTEFSAGDCEVSEVFLKGGATETIEIPASETGTTLIWDLTVLGWEVNYKEEFVPTDEGSYTTIIQKGKKMGAHEEAVRNSFRSNEPGKVVVTIENSSSYKKKRVLYRYKVKAQ